ncbi:uncharacterized protein PHALS_13141 [Plasmopara halstedii]|uniref:Uncharacterized protein n=1 Tax=Plasmopara halstedii TaxID=4781 RepID=A0A0P1ANF1_PLAHL|nr:uncharacterized protein PHALS_13141 [Plasmopara halstedii]CEG42905.1 hypothetical protein PHALS_13141 [Plasmopara halstedii]|eukprot:XP_024579274.1 hypothetical protein PHALS_13141 [Plasmopara halstedii]
MTTSGKPLTLLQMAVEETKKHNRKLPHVAPHGLPTGANQITQILSDRDDALSISMFDSSNGKISPSDSPMEQEEAQQADCTVNVKRLDALNTSSESALFIEKHHTMIKKVAKATPILEITESMINGENTAQLDTLPNKFAEADETLPSMIRLIEDAANPDHIVRSAAACSLAFYSALSLAMTTKTRRS